MSHLALNELSASLDSALTGADLERALAHLSMCARCRDRQARLALHDDALRRLLADDPDDRVLDELARRSEAIATAITRGEPVPPVVTSTPRAPEMREYGPIERLARFAPPEQAEPPTVEQETTATPARAEEPLPPPRDPSRAIPRPDALPTGEPLDVTPRLDTDRPKSPDKKPAAEIIRERHDALKDRARPVPDSKPAPGIIASGYETFDDRAPAVQDPKPAPENLTESYDAFNDRAYLGPGTGQRPPRIGDTPSKKPAGAEPDSPRREYRHGGVRPETPVTAKRSPDSGERSPARSQPAETVQEFGVRRAAEPAWARLGLQPDPLSPGAFRDPLTGASVSPPPVTARRPAPSRGSSRSGSRTALIATLATVGGLVVVALALRIPAAQHLSIQWGLPNASTRAQAPAGLEIHDATTRPPVDVPVPQPVAGATGTEPPRVCGQLVDAQGHAVAGALLTVVGASTSVRSDADGRFCLAASAGGQDIDVVDARGATRRIRLELVAGAPEARIVLP
jgi:hypothetical protein